MTDEMVRVVESQWLSELIQELLLGLLAKDQQFTNEVLKNIRQDIADAEAKDTSWAAQSTELKMQQLFLEFSGSLPNFMDALCMVGSAAKKPRTSTTTHVAYRGLAWQPMQQSKISFLFQTPKQSYQKVVRKLYGASWELWPYIAPPIT